MVVKKGVLQNQTTSEQHRHVVWRIHINTSRLCSMNAVAVAVFPKFAVIRIRLNAVKRFFSLVDLFL